MKVIPGRLPCFCRFKLLSLTLITTYLKDKNPKKLPMKYNKNFKIKCSHK